MANVAHVGHAELLTPELAASQRFFILVLGMTVVAESANAVYLRGYGQYQRTDLKLSASSVAGLGHLGDPETRTWTAADRARGVGWGTRFPDSWRTYGTPTLESR